MPKLVRTIAFAPLLANWALAFGPAEYFALMVLALSCLGGLVGDSLLKAMVGVLIGLMLSCVGIDANSGVYRFTFDLLHLSDGIPFIVVVIGLFAVSELMLMLQSHHGGVQPVEVTGRTMFNTQEFMRARWTILRSSVVGFFVGVLPGAGASIASAMTYSMERRMAGKDHTFGEGDVRGVAAPEAANNASAYGSLIPMLTLGVPGSGTTAVMWPGRLRSTRRATIRHTSPTLAAACSAVSSTSRCHPKAGPKSSSQS